MEKFQEKYRIKSHRKPNWDYSEDALYFITIVTQNREGNLGTIETNKMILSDFGKIVEDEWFKSFQIRKELILHEFVLMPNHLHAIVEIYNDAVGNDGMRNDAVGDDGMGNDADVETHGRVSLPTDTLSSLKRNPPIRLPKSISSFIAGFKSAVNTEIDNFIDNYKLSIPKYNKDNHFFQPNYHDHIIKNNIEYQLIKNYIIDNPIKWGQDKLKKLEQM